MTKFSVVYVYVVIVLLLVSYDSIQSVFGFCTTGIIITKTTTTSSNSRICRRSLFGDRSYCNDNPSLNFFERCCITQLFETTNAKYEDMMDGESNKNNKFDKDEDDDDEDNEKPYLNRSLSWTKKYRQLLPFHIIRQMVHKMGIQSKDEWDDLLQDGGVGPYIPNYPDEMYYNEWESWDDFLGIIRSYNDTKYLIQSILHITTIDQYNTFINDNKQRAENLRIPSQPEKHYKYCNTWISYKDFFGIIDKE